MKIQYILHADFETPGVIHEWAQERGHYEKIIRPFAGEKLPNSPDCDFLILMGGPQSPLETKESPYLLDEITYVQKALHNDIPILGFCLGAQIIGEALGGRTARSPHKEVGVFPIELTQEGREDPLLRTLASHFPVVHWHNDMPGLTADAKVLAFSEGCPRQIVRYRPSVYGFQCHLEPTRENIEGMIRHCPQDLKPGRFVQTAEEFLSQDFETINTIMCGIMDRMVDLFHHSRSSPLR